MKALLLIGCGSFAGGVLRYGVSRLLQGSQWLSLPLGTFCVNILGCLLLGICYVSLSVAAGLLAVHAGHWLVKMG